MSSERRMCIGPEVTWKDITPGGIITEAGNAEAFKTGDWRTSKPVWNSTKCKHCLFCWAVCPDNSIETESGKMTGIDYDHCKGCGVCTKQCKFGALEYIPEK